MISNTEGTMQPDKKWNVLKLLNTTTQYFEDKKVENPRLNAEYLLGKSLGLKRFDLYVAFERPITTDELTVFRNYVKRRSQFEPLQYILGETEFMGFPFKVTKDVLIPRPETEILVESVLEFKGLLTNEPVIVDVGSGSGCIAISLEKLWPQAQIIATDVSEDALNVARQNALLNASDKDQSNGGNATFINHDIFNEWPDSLPSRIDLLVSNPPYVTNQEMQSLQIEVKDWEPAQALTDFDDGLKFYKRFFELARNSQRPEIKYLCLEMSGSQPQKIIELANGYGFNNIDVTDDLNRIPRVLTIKV